ncbi:MAG: CapA family protein [Calditrichia bacterium]
MTSIHKLHLSVISFFIVGILGVSMGSSSLAASDPSTVKIVAGGDLMLGSWAGETIRERGWDYPFSRLDTILSDAQVVFANLEAPFGTGGQPVEKSYTFQVHPDLIQVLKSGRINVVSLANNHILDFGPGVLQETFDLLQRNSIHYTGAGRNKTESCVPAVIDVGGVRLAFAAYSLTFPEEFWATDSTAGTCFTSHTFFYDDLRKFKQESDVLIVSFHWGGELLSAPKDYQRDLARRTIDAGADIILGHHPHVVQGIQIYREKPIFYSLGNFVFGSYSEKAREGMLIKIIWGTQGGLRCRIYPINVYNKEVEFQPYVLEGEKKRLFLENLNRISLELNDQRNVIGKDAWIMF